MTSWSCSACTFDSKPGVSKCEICGTAAAAVSSNASSCSSSTLPPTRKPKSSKSRQATLLGGFVSKQEEERSVKPKQSKKRSATVASAEVTQQRPSRKIAPAASNNNTASMPCSTVPAHLQVKRNNVKLSELSLESQRVMKEVFGIDKLRNLQPQAIQYALRCQSQLIVMATGGGKSLCYQLPAIVRGGTTIVVSPLKALIADQVNALLKLGISAAFISSSNTASQNREVMERLLLQQQRQPISKQKAATSATAAASSGSQQQQQPITLLYCTPEQIKTDKFRDCLMTMNQENRLAGFAVDEAHCISSWGHDFRSAYLKLNWLRETFPHLPLMACTATATKKVIQDIQEILNLKDRPLLIGSFDRKNVFYKVRYKDVLDMSPRGSLGDLLAFVQNQHDKHTAAGTVYSGIVYVHKKADTAELARAITAETGIRAETYHGGMKDTERKCVQDAWTTGQVPIVIATVAFGMGVDLAHVRFVIHWTMPKNVESFYQESGRAGRDGLAAYSLLYHSRDEQSTLKYLASLQKSTKDNNNNNAQQQRALDGLEKMAKYCLEPGCRRQYLLRFFGEKEEDTNPKTVCQESCDYCVNPDKVTRAIEAASCANDFTYHTRPAKATNGQWATGPQDDEDDDEDNANDDFGKWDDSNGLKITGGTDDEDDETMPALPENDSKPSAAGFEKASAILERYQAIECQENTSNGFVRFRSLDDTDDVAKKRKTAHPPTLPEHLRASAPDPLLHFEAKSVTTTTTAKDASAEVARLRAESEKAAKAARDALAAARNKKGSAPPPPPPPPSLTFSTKRR